MLGAWGVSGIFLNEKKITLPSKLARCIAFISGTAFTELIFLTIPIVWPEMPARSRFLGVSVFELFFALAIGFKFLKKVLAQ